MIGLSNQPKGWSRKIRTWLSICTARPGLDGRRGRSDNARISVHMFGTVLPRKRVPMETHNIQRVLRARYGGVEASDILVQFARIELERPDALTWMQNGKFYEVYGDVARLLGRLLDLRVAEKPLMTDRNGHPFGIAIGNDGENSWPAQHGQRRS